MLQWKLLTNGKIDTIVEEVNYRANSVANDANQNYTTNVEKNF